jgi:ankyrin repeat protein
MRLLSEHDAASKQYRICADFFLANQRGKTALMVAAEISNTDCVRVLLEAGADIHAADDVRG